MTSNNPKDNPNYKPPYKPLHLVPKLSPEVEAKSVNGLYQINLPAIRKGSIRVGEKDVPTLQFACQSLFVKKPNELSCCNSVVKTVIGSGTGDQTELIECGKCRTSYILRTIYNKDGTVEFKTAIYDVSRNVQNYGKYRCDKNYNYWVEFNKPNKDNS